MNKPRRRLILLIVLLVAALCLVAWQRYGPPTTAKDATSDAQEQSSITPAANNTAGKPQRGGRAPRDEADSSAGEVREKPPAETPRAVSAPPAEPTFFYEVNVVNESGQPVAGLEVTISSRTYAATKSTDDLGRVRFDGLAKGAYFRDHIFGAMLIKGGKFEIAGNTSVELVARSAVLIEGSIKYYRELTELDWFCFDFAAKDAKRETLHYLRNAASTFSFYVEPCGQGLLYLEDRNGHSVCCGEHILSPGKRIYLGEITFHEPPKLGGGGR